VQCGILDFSTKKWHILVHEFVDKKVMGLKWILLKSGRHGSMAPSFAATVLGGMLMTTLQARRQPQFLPRDATQSAVTRQ